MVYSTLKCKLHHENLVFQSSDVYICDQGHAGSYSDISQKVNSPFKQIVWECIIGEWKKNVLIRVQ